MITRFKTIDAPSQGEYKEKGSRFVAYAYPLADASAAKQILSDVKREHPKARHHCFAYRVGFDGSQHRANDDGEPSGTAGKPILGQIDSFGLTNTIVVVVRYFGGVLLGASGLNHAYKSAARIALEAAAVSEHDVMHDALLSFDAQKLPAVMAALKKQNVSTKGLRFNDGYELNVSMPLAIKDSVMNTLVEIGVSTKAL